MPVADDAATYSPERIAVYLRAWQELQAQVEGATGSIGGGRGTARDRADLACLISDLERAADALPLDWKATCEIFRMQGRGRTWANRRLHLDEDVTVERAIEFMAHQLGWRP